MALTTLQIEYCLELLNVPPNSVVFTIDRIGLNTTQIFGIGPLSAVTAIKAQIAALNTDQQTIVTNILNDYINIVDISPGIQMAGGSISASINGVSVNFEEAIAKFKMRLKHYLPFWETFETRHTQDAQIGAMRASVLM